MPLGLSSETPVLKCKMLAVAWAQVSFLTLGQKADTSIINKYLGTMFHKMECKSAQSRIFKTLSLVKQNEKPGTLAPTSANRKMTGGTC